MSEQPSGKFVLRIDPGLHAALRAAAEASGSSLNEYCARKLASPGWGGDPAASAVIERAASLFGSGLVGVLVFGSWARGEATEGSDVDVLVVVGADVELSRALYRAWDTRPLTWDGRRVEAHVARLPARGARLTSLWAEAAVDGVVLYDRGLELSRRLAEVRDRIAAGELVRRRVHGQPYWVEAA
jgi:predicted nucleotidyltransferase